MKIFLTGGTGFIGSYVVMELIKEGHEITILARDKNKIPEFNENKQIKVVQGDIKDYKLLEELVKDNEACILIALNYTKSTGFEVLNDDTAPTVYIADIAARENVKHFIYTSSTAVNDNLYMGVGNDKEDKIHKVTANTKQRPATFYGATKAASENYLMAVSYLSSMRVNIIRPGYTFGNPILKGATTQSDTRFEDIVNKALRNEPIPIIKNDGTHFIWAGHLAKLYVEVLKSNLNRKMYYGVAKDFVSWYAIAEEAIKKLNSKSRIILEDKGYREGGVIWDTEDMKNEFGLEFNPWDQIKRHLDYYIEKVKNS